MNTYTFHILTPWWLVPATLAVALGITLWAYGRPVEALSSRHRLLLGTLRFLALLSLALALWQPVIGTMTSYRQTPQVAVLLDNSASMRLRDASGPRELQYRKALQQLADFLRSPHVRLLRFDAAVKPLERWHWDSLSLDGPATDLGQALRWVATEAQHRNIGAVLLLSDGVVNAGQSPLAEAEVIGRPIVTVLVGDTTAIPDVSVHSLLVNERIPLGSSTLVYATVGVEGFGEQELRVEFWEDSRRIGEQSLYMRAQQAPITVTFRYQPTTEGVHRLRVRVRPIPGEASTRNNEATALVEVTRLRHHILLFAGSPSPDLAFLRRELQRHPWLQLSTFVHKDATSFYEGTPSLTLLRQAEAFLFIDFPLRSTPDALIASIAEQLARGRPCVLLFGPQTDRTKLRLLEPWLPVSVSTGGALREFAATVSPTHDGLLHPLLQLPTSDAPPPTWHTLPPIFAFANAASPKSTSEILAVATSGALREPFLVAQQQPNRSLVLLGYGLHRWKLMGYAAELARKHPSPTDYLATFVTNLTQWLLTEEGERRIRIRPLKRFYAAGEPVHFWASIADAAGNPVESALVRLSLKSGNESRELILSPAEPGIYRGYLPSPPPGEYTFVGEAIVQGEQVGRDYGTVSVGDVTLEERSLRAEADLLRALAHRTGGIFLPADSAAAAPRWIERLPGSTPVISTARHEFRLWHSPWLLIASLLLFSTEWILRRRWGQL